MDFELSVIEGGKVGLVVSHICISKDAFSRLLTIVNQFGEDNRTDLIIYDFRQHPLEIPTFEQYDFVYNISIQIDNKPGRKIALLVKKEDHSYDFIETLYLNSGRLMRRFDNETEAVAWLIKS